MSKSDQTMRLVDADETVIETAELARVRAERDAARQWARAWKALARQHGRIAAQLFSVKWACSYCDHQFPIGGANREAVMAHAAVCPKHPVRTSEAERDRLRGLLSECRVWLGDTWQWEDELKDKIDAALAAPASGEGVGNG